MEHTYKHSLQILLDAIPEQIPDALPEPINEQIDDVITELKKEEPISLPTGIITQSTNLYQNSTALIEWLMTQPFGIYVIFKKALEKANYLTVLDLVHTCEVRTYMERELHYLYKDAPHTEGRLNFSGPFNSVGVDRDDAYARNENGKKGLALIINNVNFMKKTALSKRNGSDVDCANISKLLETLGYEVKTYNDKTKREMEIVIKNFKDMRNEHRQADSTVVVILSHGKLDNIYGTDGKLMKWADLKIHFDANNCPELAGKPKLFFIQACRTEPLLEPETAQSDVCQPTEEIYKALIKYIRRLEQRLIEHFPISVQDLQSDRQEDIPKYADFFVAYSTTPGYVTWRCEKKGSWFIQVLCQVIAENAKKDDIFELLIKVNNQIAARMCYDQTKQISEQTHLLRKKFYF